MHVFIIYYYDPLNLYVSRCLSKLFPQNLPSNRPHDEDDENKAPPLDDGSKNDQDGEPKAENSHSGSPSSTGSSLSIFKMDIFDDFKVHDEGNILSKKTASHSQILDDVEKAQKLDKGDDKVIHGKSGENIGKEGGQRRGKIGGKDGGLRVSMVAGTPPRASMRASHAPSRVVEGQGKGKDGGRMGASVRASVVAEGEEGWGGATLGGKGKGGVGVRIVERSGEKRPSSTSSKYADIRGEAYAQSYEIEGDEPTTGENNNTEDDFDSIVSDR